MDTALEMNPRPRGRLRVETWSAGSVLASAACIRTTMPKLSTILREHVRKASQQMSLISIASRTDDLPIMVNRAPFCATWTSDSCFRRDGPALRAFRPISTRDCCRE